MGLQKKGNAMKMETGGENLQKRENEKRKKGGDSKCWYNTTKEGINIIIDIQHLTKINYYQMSAIVEVQR